jgi:hypothetical protein
MADDGFTRPTQTVDQALTMACSRRTAAINNRDAALLRATQADTDVMTYERHIEMCDRQISGLLDERLRSHMADAGS